MGEMSEFSLAIRMFLKAYRWRRIDPVPWAVPSKPLSKCRLGLISSAGFVGPGDDPFDPSVRGGDSMGSTGGGVCRRRTPASTR